MAAPKGNKVRVGVIFGGRSTEHEVSLASARAIMDNLDHGRYEVLPLFVTQTGRWLLMLDARGVPEQGREVHFSLEPGKNSLLIANGGDTVSVDVLIPMIHGTYGEDGTLQGLLELLEIPFVGSGCLSSAVSMNKGATKAILRAGGLPVLPSLTISREEWGFNKSSILKDSEANFDFPLFVKPTSLGSSVGIHRIVEASNLEKAIEDALSYDFKVLIEEEARGREFECAVLEDPGGRRPLASPLAEIKPKEGWYDYKAKYTPGFTDIIIPAELDGVVVNQMQTHARAAFSALDCSGLARVDFFYRETRGEIYINEVNTLPGFTELSGYPKMIESAGISYSSMLDRLIACAFFRHARSRELTVRRAD